MEGFIKVSYWSNGFIVKIKVHYTQVYSNMMYWYWNDKCLCENEEEIIELIKKSKS